MHLPKTVFLFVKLCPNITQMFAIVKMIIFNFVFEFQDASFLFWIIPHALSFVYNFNPVQKSFLIATNIIFEM